MLTIPIFQFLKNSDLFSRKIPEIDIFEPCLQRSSSFINVENVNFEIIYLAIYPEIENIKCLLTVHSYYKVEEFVNVIYYSSPFFYLFSFVFGYLLIFYYFKTTKVYFFSFLIALYISVEVFLYNADFTFFINTFLFFIFSIFIKNKNIEGLYKNKPLLFILYSLSSKHLIEFLKVKFQLSFDPSIFFEVIFLVIVLYRINNLDKNKNQLKMISFVPLLGVLLLVFESLFFALNQASRTVYYILILSAVILFISNIKIKSNKNLNNFLNSSISILTVYLFLGFLNSDYFINKLFAFFIILIIFIDILEIRFTNRIFENKIFSLFILLFFLSQTNINNFFNNNNDINDTQLEDSANLNVVQILFDGLPGRVGEEMFNEKKINNFHIYPNFYSTGLNTQPAISDMLTGSNFDNEQSFTQYFNNLSDNPENYLNKLNSKGVKTHLITDRFINDIIFQEASNIFDFKLINRGENENWEIYSNFYENKIPYVYRYKTVPDGMKVIIDYILDILTIKSYDTNVIIERGALVGIDNLAKFYDVYQSNKNIGQNYYYVHVSIPHIPFVMDKDCNYIENVVGDANNSPEIVNGQIECAKELINILSDKLQSDNTLLLIHGDHSLNEIISDEQDYIKERLNAGLLIRYPNYDYQSDQDLVLVNDKFFTTDLSNLITSYYKNTDSFLKNVNSNDYLNVVDGLADNYKNKDVNIIKVTTTDW